jgi:signal transduction histidine kinase
LFSSVLAKIEPSYFNFLSGILLSTAINVYTGIFLSENIPEFLAIVIASAVLMIISSALLTNLGIKLQNLRNLALEASPRNFSPSERENILLELIARNLINLFSKFSLAVLLAIVGFALLSIPFVSGFQNNGQQSKTYKEIMPIIQRSLKDVKDATPNSINWKNLNHPSTRVPG